MDRLANSQEHVADDHLGRRIQQFWIEDEARMIDGTNLIVDGRPARLIIEALGV